MNEIFGLGFIPSGEDSRDFTFGNTEIDLVEKHEPHFKVSHLPGIYNQGNIGMCVGFSLAKIKEGQELKERKVQKRYSPAFIYANRADGDYKGEGMMPREALKQLSKYGTVDYEDFPMLDKYPACRTNFDNNINNLLPLAQSQRIGYYIRLKTNEEIMSFLKAEDTPSLICIHIHENFRVGSDGIVSMPQGRMQGGHAMTLCGWTTIGEEKYWIVSNSWGEQWGNNGYCYIPFAYPKMEIWGVTDRISKKQAEIPQEINFVVDEPIMYTEDKLIKMDTAAKIENGRTLVPVRYLAEILGFDVGFEVLRDGRKIVTIRQGGELKK